MREVIARGMGQLRHWMRLLERSRRLHPPPPATAPCHRRCRCYAAAAIKTPYLPNGKFDLEAYDAMVDHQIQVGAGRVYWAA